VPVNGYHLPHSVRRPDHDDDVPEEHDDGGQIFVTT
jgi:hypothetical protein